MKSRRLSQRTRYSSLLRMINLAVASVTIAGLLGLVWMVADEFCHDVLRH